MELKYPFTGKNQDQTGAIYIIKADYLFNQASRVIKKTTFVLAGSP